MNSEEKGMLMRSHKNSEKLNDFFFGKDFESDKTRAEEIDKL